MFTKDNAVKVESVLVSKKSNDRHISERDMLITNLITEKIKNCWKYYKTTEKIHFDEVFPVQCKSHNSRWWSSSL